MSSHLKPVPATTIPVSERALIGRINRAMKDEEHVLKTAKEGTRLYSNVGRHYVINWRINGVVDSYVDLEALAKEYGCLKEWERLEE